MKEVDSTVEAGAQFQQMVNVECVTDFHEQPDLNLTFYYTGEMKHVDIKLPVRVLLANTLMASSSLSRFP